MTSLDSNIIITSLDSSAANQKTAQQAILNARGLGPLQICLPVYAELRASANWEDQIVFFLENTGIQVNRSLPESLWDKAGQALGNYARLRKRGQLPRRILADFLIAAHAEHHQLAVLTFDDTIYKAVFPRVRLVPI
jgi:hypothetical protein